MVIILAKKELEMRSIYNTFRFLSFIIALLILITGCGSSGGGDSSQTLIPLSTSEIRTYQPGDSIIFSVAFTDTATREKVSGDATMTIGALVKNPSGIDCREVIYSGTLTGTAGSMPYSVKELIYQETDNSLFLCGKYDDALGGYVFVGQSSATPLGLVIEAKSPIQLGDTKSVLVFFTDGTWQDCTTTVVAKENVSIPLGLYESYKVSDTCSYSDGSSHVGTKWYVPNIFTLKETHTLYDMGDVYDVEIVVKSYSFK